MNNRWINQEIIIKNKLIDLLPNKIYNLKDKKQLIFFINSQLNKKYTLNNFNNIEKIKNIIINLNLTDLYQINNGENFNIIKSNTIPNIYIKKIKQYIFDKKLNISCSIFDNNKNILNYNNEIYAMHSIGKVFTGFLIMILLNLKIITKKDINSPIQIDPIILNTMPIKVKNRLKTTTMLDAMTHMSGLKDYLTKYSDALKINNKINPLNPEDFVKYIDDDVVKQGIYNYSNAGILLCGLSVQYLYNKNKKTNKNYNEILYEYIIKPSKITTFSIIKPKNGIYNKINKLSKFINGSPGGGYWISCYDLSLFGNFVINMCYNNKQIFTYLKKYGSEFYFDNLIRHFGGINGSKCLLSVYLKNKISIVIMDNDGNSTGLLHLGLNIFD